MARSKVMYAVGAQNQHGRMKNEYFDSYEEAVECAEALGNAWEFVEIMQGTFGNWTSIYQSW